MREKASPKKAPRLTREEWLARALEVIQREGRGWIGINELVEQVGVTKGSFYWHFTNRIEFVAALLDYWLEEFTGRAPKMIEVTGGSPEDRLLALMELISNEELGRLDIAIRAWALRESVVAEAVGKSDRIRLDYVGSLFREIGFTGDDLEMRVRTFVVYHSFEAAFSEHECDEDRQRRLKLRHAFLVHPTEPR